MPEINKQDRAVLAAILDNNPNMLQWGLDDSAGNKLCNVIADENGNIIYLDLGRRHIKYPRPIHSLIHLQYLDLSHNDLTSIPPEIEQLTNLKYLKLNFNRLTQLTTQILSLTKLIELDLGYNKLTFIPANIGHLTQLKSLELYGNEITSIPVEITQLTNLTRFTLGGYDLTRSTLRSIGKLSQLQCLQLSCRLGYFPIEICDLRDLRILDLSFNSLTSIPAEIGLLSNLTELILEHNQLTNFPNEMRQLNRLIKLDLNYNMDLATLPDEINLLPTLSKLNLEGTDLIESDPLCNDGLYDERTFDISATEYFYELFLQLETPNELDLIRRAINDISSKAYSVYQDYNDLPHDGNELTTGEWESSEVIVTGLFPHHIEIIRNQLFNTTGRYAIATTLAAINFFPLYVFHFHKIKYFNSDDKINHSDYMLETLSEVQIVLNEVHIDLQRLAKTSDTQSIRNAAALVKII